MYGLQDIKAMNERAAKTARGVNVHISDLFFNRDHNEAFKNGRYDNAVLHEDALMLLASLAALGLTPLPTADQLVEDFHSRL